MNIWTDRAVMDILLSWSSLMKSFCSCLKCWKENINHGISQIIRQRVALSPCQQRLPWWTPVQKASWIQSPWACYRKLVHGLSCAPLQEKDKREQLRRGKDDQRSHLVSKQCRLPLNILASCSISLLMRQGCSPSGFFSRATRQKACRNPTAQKKIKQTSLNNFAGYKKVRVKSAESESTKVANDVQHKTGAPE